MPHGWRLCRWWCRGAPRDSPPSPRNTHVYLFAKSQEEAPLPTFVVRVHTHALGSYHLSPPFPCVMMAFDARRDKEGRMRGSTVGEA